MMRERRPNIRPVRGITADTVRALIGLRHAGSDCAYLPLERYQLADEVKGSVPPPCIDPADVPATLRADCDSYPATPNLIGFDRAREGSDRTVVSMRGKSGTVIVDEFFSFASPPGQKPAAKVNAKGAVSPKLRVPEAAPNLSPSVAQPVPSAGCDDAARSAPLAAEPIAPAIPATPSPVETDNGRAFASKSITGGAERTFRAVIGKEPRARREDDRPCETGADQGGRSAGASVADRPARRVHGSARPGTAARAARPHAERDTAAPILKPQRLDLIRDIAARLEARKTPAPRPIVGPRIERKAVLPLAGDPIAQRREAIEQAIRFLRARCILVTWTDRNAMIRKYRVSGKRDTMLAEQVIEHAVSLGMEPAHP